MTTPTPIVPLPSCMIGPSEPCDAFQQLQRELAAEREAHEATRAALKQAEAFMASEAARCEAAEAALAEARKDVEMLDWAESNPVAAYSNIVAQWADCGRGGRESFFNFRHAIDAARKETK